MAELPSVASCSTGWISSVADRVPTQHGRHDVEVVAALAAGDATDAQATEARYLIDACDDCLQLSRDVRSLTLGLQSLPNAEQVAAAIPAPRDFRLTPEIAARLRPASPLLRLNARLTLAFASFGRPVGASMATLGLVGILVGSSNLGGPAFGAAGAGELNSTQASPGAPGLSATFDAGGMLPQATHDRVVIAGPTDSKREEANPPAVDSTYDMGGAATAGWVTVASGVLIVLGTVLFLLGWMGRRRVRSRT